MPSNQKTNKNPVKSKMNARPSQKSQSSEALIRPAIIQLQFQCLATQLTAPLQLFLQIMENEAADRISIVFSGSCNVPVVIRAASILPTTMVNERTKPHSNLRKWACLARALMMPKQIERKGEVYNQTNNRIVRFSTVTILVVLRSLAISNGLMLSQLFSDTLQCFLVPLLLSTQNLTIEIPARLTCLNVVLITRKSPLSNDFMIR